MHKVVCARTLSKQIDSCILSILLAREHHDYEMYKAKMVLTSHMPSGMIKHVLRMKAETEWWRLRNFLSGCWSNHVLRFPFYSLFFKLLLQLRGNFLCQFFLSLDPLIMHFLFFYTENILHVILKQVWHIWEEDPESKNHLSIIHFILARVYIGYYHFNLMSCTVQVPLNVCEWFKDYQPVSTGKQEIEHAYE